MKTSMFALFLLCVSTSSYLPSSTADPLFDTDGDVLLNGGTYYALPVITGKGGGIDLAATGNETCPLTVVQSPNELSKGKPIKISSPFRIFNIFDTFFINIQFPSVPPCGTDDTVASYWTIEGVAVKLVAQEQPALPRSFKIAKASSSHHDIESKDYKFVVCSDDDNNTCRGYIGINVDSDGVRRLVVSEKDPLLVRFQKATTSAA